VKTCIYLLGILMMIEFMIFLVLGLLLARSR
jgi:hypothetical protein